MRKAALTRAWAVLLASAALLAAAPAAQGAASDPLFVFVPHRPPGDPAALLIPPPYGYWYGPCGAAVDSAGSFYVSDYYHHAIDVYDENANYTSKKPPVSGATGYLGQLADVDPLDGPCGLAVDAADNLYVNYYHRGVVKYPPFPGFGSPMTIAGLGVDSTHPTGVAVDPATANVYVNHRTYIGVYDSSGVPVLDGPQPLRIGEGTLENGYGLAFSQHPGTAGRLYVPDAATETIKVYDPTVDKVTPVAEIDGSETPNGEFVSLRDAAVAVDRVSGEVYVLDNLHPEYTEEPEAIVYVFDAAGAYEGHLKFNVVDALPVGIAVDNTANPTQGRVYVTSGNTDQAGIYVYPPGAATTAPLQPVSFSLALTSTGSGGGGVSSDLGSLECTTACEAEIRAGAEVSLSADPDPGSLFAGWSGACSGTAPSCSLQMNDAAVVRARFTDVAGPPPVEPSEPFTAATSSPVAAGTAVRRRARTRHRHHRRAHDRRLGHRRIAAKGGER